MSQKKPTKRTKRKGLADKPISLYGVDFETAVAAAMATGKPPKKKNSPQKSKVRKPKRRS
jgi:hypothetical protein